MVRPAAEVDERTQVLNLIDYLAAYDAQRTPSVRDVADHRLYRLMSADLPDHDAVRLHPEDGCWLSVEFVELPTKPKLPVAVAEALRSGDFDAGNEPEIVEAPEEPVSQDDKIVAEWLDEQARWEEQAEAARGWIDQIWRPWAEDFQRGSRAKRLHRDLFEQRERLTADRESMELVWGFGRMLWSSPQGRVDHPLVTVPVEIEVVSGTEEIRIRPAGAADVESRFLNGLDLFDRAGYTAVRQAVAADGLNPWLTPDLQDIYTRLVRAVDDEGVIRSGESTAATGHPTMDLGWTLFARRRVPDSQGFLEDMRAIYMDDGTIPEPLRMIMTSGEFDDDDPFGGSSNGAASSNSVDPLLLPLPTNEEQQRILRSAQRQAGVTVQGPPGTGKSHTIANLISHYVAYGKRVLVVAEKEQALKVLADKVPAGIRDLTVSVLGADDEGRKRLESSIMSIQTRVAAVDRTVADRRIQQLTAELDRIDRATAETTTTMLRARKAETITLPGSWPAGNDITPQQAAAWTSKNRARLGYIPDAIDPSAACPLNAVELREFTRLLGTVGISRADQATLLLPAVAELPGLSQLDALLRRHDESARLTEGARIAAGNWRRTGEAKPETLTELAESLVAEREWLASVDETWQGVVHRQLTDPIMAGQWHQLRDQLNSVRPQAMAIRARLDLHRVEIPAQPRSDLRAGLQDAHARLSAKRKLGMFAGDAKRALDECRVDGHTPATADEVQLCLDALTLGDLRASMATVWGNQACRVGAPALGDLIEDYAGQAVADLADVLASTDRWQELNERLDSVGGRPMSTGSAAEHLDARASWCRQASAQVEHRALTQQVSGLERYLRDGSGRASASPLWAQLVEALSIRDFGRWERLRIEAGELASIRDDALRLKSVRDRMAAAAPGWTQEIVQDPGRAMNPEDLVDAWQWRQMDCWIRGVAAMPAPAELQTKLDELAQDRRRTVSELVVERAWRRLADNLGRPQREALQSYVQAVKKYGKTGGKYAQRWIEMMRRALDDSKEAVPVWIMSTSRALTSFRPSPVPPFDVIVIDEASQIGFEALPLLALAKSAIVVGDDKQTSPENVGLDRQRVFDLMDDYLQPIPNFRVLFDPDNSLYDLAIQKFAEPIMLTEHFRCLPEIIGFSNVQAYDNRIIPLRDRPPSPGWIPLGLVRVLDGYRNGDVNEPEAIAVADLITRLCGQPEYDGMTFGVISLLGTAQSKRIWELLYDRLGPDEFERRKVRCGEAANFQGDERDVMVLSTVVSMDSAKRIGPMTGVKHLRRINVAASRAQNQMWVVTSVDADAFPAGDLRAALIRHCANPESAQSTYEDAAAKCESDFERRVLNDLVARGYRAIVAQYPVGNYRIDLVVEGPESRLAVECDGDRWHGEDVWYQDRARQEVLERAGWTFARIRGSSYYRDPENAMQPVWERLAELGIPTGDEWMTRSDRSILIEVSGASEPAVRTDGAGMDGQHVPDPAAVLTDLVDERPIEFAPPGLAAAPDFPVRMEPHDKPWPRLAPRGAMSGSLTRKAETATPPGPVEPKGIPTGRPSSVVNGPFSLIPYRQWVSRVLPPVATASSRSIQLGLIDIVTAEGPMHASAAFELYVKASGGRRVGTDIRRTLSAVATRTLAGDQLLSIKDAFDEPADKTIYVPGQDPVVARTLGTRELYDVPRSEIRKLIEVLDPTDELGDDRIKREILNAYGLKSLTRKASDYLDECIAYEWEVDSPRPGPTVSDQEIA